MVVPAGRSLPFEVDGFLSYCSAEKNNRSGEILLGSNPNS